MSTTAAPANPFARHVDVLGRSAHVRGFVLTLLLTTRYHLMTRPISAANTAFFDRGAALCDGLLALLREPGWEPLPGAAEEGLARLRPISDWPDPVAAKQELATLFLELYRRYFRGLSLPWSRLAPADDLRLDAWPVPRQVLVAVGANIGIGDEMLFFRLAGRLARRYPGATLSVSSFHRSLWDLCPGVDVVHYESGDQLAPFVRAFELLRRAPDSLVVFVEFAADPVYRQLERVPGFSRFAFLDTGSRCARLVDQGRWQAAEYRARTEPTVYHVLAKLMDRIGLPGPGGAGVAEPPLWAPGVETTPAPAPPARRVFVNPFSSKKYEQVAPAWWAEALAEAAARGPLTVELFAGISEASRAYARAIAAGLDTGTVRLYGADTVPSIADTLAHAAGSDAVFGLDTFTGHIGILRERPCLTVFLGSEWLGWQVPDRPVLNIRPHEPARTAGALLARLLWPPGAELACLLRPLVAETERVAALPDGGARTRAALALLPAWKAALLRWSEADPALAADFTDVPDSHAAALEEAVARLPPPVRTGEASSPAVAQLVDDALNQWRGSNLFRYARYAAAAARPAP